MADEYDSRSKHNKLLLLRTRELDSWPLESLIEMSRDPDPEVRDWAVFAIAARDDDGDEVRNALIERATDSDFDARSEALWGLARRREERALPLLIEALQGEQIGTLFVEAAGFFARPELVEPLEDLQACWEDDVDLLAEALARCRGEHLTGGRLWDVVTANDR
jgi:hypothetical protein